LLAAFCIFCLAFTHETLDFAERKESLVPPDFLRNRESSWRLTHVGGVICDVKVFVGIVTMNRKAKSEVIAEFRLSENDTGSCDVQIALLSARIRQLTEHLREHRKDFHSRRGLIAMANRRRRLLAYVRHRDEGKYGAIIHALGLRK
jgi:small subunit ribosomal protein S15